LGSTGVLKGTASGSRHHIFSIGGIKAVLNSSALNVTLFFPVFSSLEITPGPVSTGSDSSFLTSLLLGSDFTLAGSSLTSMLSGLISGLISLLSISIISVLTSVLISGLRSSLICSNLTAIVSLLPFRLFGWCG